MKELGTIRYGRFQQWMNLIGLLKYGIFFLALLLYLPATAFNEVPGNEMVGGLFLELKFLELLLTSMALFAAWWSVMFTEGLIVDGLEGRMKQGGSATSKDRGPTGYIPEWAEKFFGVPVTPHQFGLFTFLAMVGVVIIASHSTTEFWLRPAAIVGAALMAYLVMLFLCWPAVLADPRYRPLPDPVSRFVWEKLSFRSLQRISGWFNEKLSLFLKRFGIFPYLLENGRIKPDHYFALTNVIFLVLVLVVVSFLFSPVGGIVNYEAPASAFLFVLIVLLIWLFAIFHFHLARLRISPLVAALLVIVVGYTIWGVDHYYYVLKADSPMKGDPPTPVEVVAAGKAKENLVVVATSGGGIYAAGWTALGLEHLIQTREELKDEIRLISGVSGGAVGTAFYIDGLLRHSKDVPEEIRKRYAKGKQYEEIDLMNILDKVQQHATTSSLATTAYGFAFLDFWRFATGGLLPFSDRDRGTLLEEKWAGTAVGKKRGLARTLHPTLLDLREPIRKGLIPAVIFGATMNENGRRVMVTPITFAAKENHDRADTLWEYLKLEDQGNPSNPDTTKDYVDFAGKVPDMSLWTAARLSATFSYVSPSVRLEVRENANERGERPKGFQGQHIIDGGYHDNYGVTSALDWLQSVLEERLKENTELAFKRVLIVELRASPMEKPNKLRSYKDTPEKNRPMAGWKSALLGPLTGILAIRDTVARTRNDIDVARMIRAWEDRFDSRKDPVCLNRVVFQPKEKGPLSWHLTKTQIQDQQKQWSGSEIQDQLKKMKEFLENSCPGRK